MRVTVKTGIIAAFAWILIKMIVFYTGILGYNIVPMVMLNILGVLLAVAIGLFLLKKSETEESNALNDIKNGLTAGLPYALLVSIFIYFYYAKIDPGFIEHQLTEYETAFQKELDDPVAFQQLKESNEDFEVKSKEEIYDTVMDKARAVYSAGTNMTVSLLSLLLLATLNSIFVTVVYRRMIFRK